MYCIYHSENEGKINCNQTEMPLQEVFWESSFYQLESGLHDASKAIFSTACRGFPTPLRERDDHISAKWLLLDSSVLVAYSYVGIQTGNSTLGVLEGSATPLWSKCSLWSNLNWWVHNQILKKRDVTCQTDQLSGNIFVGFSWGKITDRDAEFLTHCRCLCIQNYENYREVVSSCSNKREWELLST